MILFVKLLAQIFNVHRWGTRISLITYSEDPMWHFDFNSQTSWDQAEMFEYFSNMTKLGEVAF